MILRKELSHLLISAGVLLGGLALHASPVLIFTNADDDLPTTVKVLKGHESAVLELKPGESGTVDLKAGEGNPVKVTLKVSSEAGPGEREPRELEFDYKIREKPAGRGMEQVLIRTAASIPLGDFTFEDDYRLSFSWAPWTSADMKNFKALKKNYQDQVMEQAELQHDRENDAELIRRARQTYRRVQREKELKAKQEQEAALQREREAADSHGCTCPIL